MYIQLVWLVSTGAGPLDYAHHRYSHFRFRNDDQFVSNLSHGLRYTD